MAVGAVAGATASLPAYAADPCDGFTWNVAHERAVFASTAAAVTAATAAGPAPTLEVDKLYDIALTPQDQVSFLMAPAKKALADGAYAGMVKLHIPTRRQVPGLDERGLLDRRHHGRQVRPDR